MTQTEVHKPPPERFMTAPNAFRLNRGPTFHSSLPSSAGVAMIDDFHLMEPATKREESELQDRLETRLIKELKQSEPKIFELADCLDVIRDGVQLMVEDDFTKCFEQRESTPWNWNFYLFPLWLVGLVFRYCILFPVRLCVLILGWTCFACGFVAIKLFLANSKSRAQWERKLIVFLCNVFVFSWTGVVKFHGVRPARKPGQIYVANHTTMADVIIMMMQQTYAIVGQRHPGWLGFIQKQVLGCLGCLWFERTSTDDRQHVAEAIHEHIQEVNRPPLLVFPEGTCVNNEYCVQFKKGVFDIPNVTIVPVAIRYNKTFCDAFWHSKKESFARYLIRLMQSWCVVCDVYYLDPVSAEPGEDAVQFAERVKNLICKKASIQSVPWDGYLKFFKLSPKYMESKQKLIAESLMRRLKEPALVESAPRGSPMTVSNLFGKVSQEQPAQAQPSPVNDPSNITADSPAASTQRRKSRKDDN